MPGICIVAIESMKQAANLPRPPLPNPASGSTFDHCQSDRGLVFDASGANAAEQGIRDVVGKRPAEQKLHRQVINPLGIFSAYVFSVSSQRCETMSRMA